jgi:hypothetical protein
MHRRGEPIRISNRDYCLLDIAYQISVIQKTAGQIEILFIFQIFIEHTSDQNQARRALNNLNSLGFINPGDNDKLVRVMNIKYIFCERFGDDVLLFNDKTAKILIQRWEDRKFPLFAGGIVNDDILDDEEDVQPDKVEKSEEEAEDNKPLSRHERDLALLETFDAPQILADHLAIQKYLNQGRLTNYHSIRPFQKHCPTKLDVHTARAVLTRLGYLTRSIPFGQTQNHWSVSEQGLDLIHEADAEPSAYPEDLLGY